MQTFSLLRLSRGQPLPAVVLGDMQKNTKTATVPGRRLDSALAEGNYAVPQGGSRGAIRENKADYALFAPQKTDYALFSRHYAIPLIRESAFFLQKGGGFPDSML